MTSRVTNLTASATSRRTVLVAAAALTAGCGSDDGGDGGATSAPATPGDTAGTSASATPGTSAPATPSAPAETSASAGAPSGKALAKTSDIPVGGGTVFKAEKVVVTQPAAGEFKAFSAICTHQGCLVNKVADGTIDCPCHGSKFRITDAAVVAGPAPRPLPAEQITVSGDSITLT
ncbi:Rieske (2Fe-2S) protein [Streptomyces sp. NBC_00233]|uniref:Rieske (2Fe-2S) protein n=1 Tax=Streptomyces sp. NBC_00233 TaxID=2975686 RepID=UPI0022536CA2|nr:Rieske 2Fe-2S domain-containing protein [Streptomyces sp. NBC_00233]MCX5225324.1 Rieske 2Fe-2S domain-containing protein [Streptomyces sp. NBC_00233]